MGVSNIKIQPMKVYQGEERFQQEKITINSSASLAGKYFVVNEPSLSNKYVYWFDDGVATAPAVAGATIVDVTYTNTDTTSDVADAIVTAAAAQSAIFTVTSDANTVTITFVDAGPVPQAHDAFTTSLKSGFVFELIRQGAEELELGCVKGSIEVSQNVDTLDVTCHASGTQPVAKLVKSISNEVTIELQETHMANLRKVMTAISGSYMPAGIGATELLGTGPASVGRNLFNDAQQLTLVPVANASGDFKNSWKFWKAIGLFDKISFSGEEVLSIPLKFSVFPDSTKPAAIGTLCIGDFTQL